MGIRFLSKVLILSMGLSVPQAIFASEGPTKNCGIFFGQLVKERKELKQALASLQKGQWDPQANYTTPAGREVSFFRNHPKGGSSRVEGKIQTIVNHGDGNLEVWLLAKTDDFTFARTPTIIPLSQVDLRSLSVKRTVTPADAEKTAALFATAMKTGQAVRFVDQFGGPRKQQGKVKSIDGTSYVFAEDHGGEVHTSVRMTHPDSVDLLPLKPRALSVPEAKLLAGLQSAEKAGNYVSFRTQGGRSELFEGWITEVEVSSAGEYLVRFNENRHQPGEGSGHWNKVKLANIDAASFNPAPKLELPQSTAKGEMAPEVVAYTDAEGKRGIAQIFGWEPTKQVSKAVPVPPTLVSELGVFATGGRVSGSQLPTGLEQAVPPGSEVRLYFEAGDRRIRLTVRHGADGSWRFGDSAHDLKTIDEDFRDEREDNSRYSLNERHQLEDERFTDALPAAQLRHHLAYIRHVMLETALPARFGEQMAQWKAALPDEMDRSEVKQLFLHDQGVSYYLDRGFIKESQAALPEVQAKRLAAIKYLMQNDMKFLNYNSGASGIAMGIYPRSAPNPTRMWLAGTDFGSDLLRAMENAGLVYSGGQWVPKTPKI